MQSCTGIDIHIHIVCFLYIPLAQVAHKSIPQAYAQSKRSNTHRIYYLGLKISFYFVTAGEHMLRTEKMSGQRTVVPNLKTLNS